MKIIISERQQKLIKENALKDSLIDMIKDGGLREATDMVGGEKNLIKLLNINTPMNFLHLFDDLDVVQSEQNPDWTLFRYKPKKNLMIYNRKNDNVYINYDEIWKILDDVFNLKYSEIQELIKEWLSEVYNLRGITPRKERGVPLSTLSEVYNLRGITPKTPRPWPMKPVV